mmetsp:Transcript_3039/g.3993  ORF Transcript_3039/g.3993 Transcript_3039/m.3993 type:complete len:96 (-) Transcript_3039:89-376(-)
MLCFPPSYFHKLKSYILEVKKPDELEPRIDTLLLFVAHELTCAYYGISPTELFESRAEHPLSPHVKLGYIRQKDYNLILEMLGRGRPCQLQQGKN